MTLTLVKCWNSRFSEMGGPINIEQKECESVMHDHYLWPFGLPKGGIRIYWIATEVGLGLAWTPNPRIHAEYFTIYKFIVYLIIYFYWHIHIDIHINKLIDIDVDIHIDWFNCDALTHRETHINPQRNRKIILDPAGIELTTYRLRPHHQLPVVKHVRFIPLKLCKKNPQP